MTAKRKGRLRGVLEYVSRGYDRFPNLAWGVIASLSYTVGALIVTYPLVCHMSSAIVGRGVNDGYQYMWSLWRTGHALFGSDRGLTQLTWLNHPEGYYHPFLLTMLTVNLTAVPFTLLLPPTLVYNLHVLSSFVLCGLTMHFFINELIKDRCAALIGGFVFAFFANKSGHALAGHLPQVIAYWNPLAALLVWRVVQRPSWRRASISGVVLAAALLVHPIHVVYFLIPVILTILVHFLTRLGPDFFAPARLRALVLTLSIAGLLSVPALWPSLVYQAEEGDLRASGTVDYSADLLALFTPSPYHPILHRAPWMPAYMAQVFPDKHSVEEGLAYPGSIVLLLATWAVIKQRRQAKTWVVLTVVCLVLSLGPILKVGGAPVVYEIDQHEGALVLPYAVLKHLPISRLSRTPNRLNETAMFALATLAGLGVSALRKQLTGSRWSPILATALAAGIVCEHLVVWPVPLSSTRLPPAVAALAREKDDGALLYLPTPMEKALNHSALLHQIACHRPIVGGRVHRRLSTSEPWETILSGLAMPDPCEKDIVPRPSAAERGAWLRYFNVDYVLISKDVSDNHTVLIPYVDDLLGAETYKDGTWAIFAVPQGLDLPGAGLLYSLSNGWSARFEDGETQVRRYSLGSGGTVSLYVAESRQGRIRFSAKSNISLAEMQLHVDDEQADRFVISGTSEYVSRPYTLGRGLHRIRFEPDTNCPQTELDDCFVFALGDIEFVPESDLAPRDNLDINFDGVIQLSGYSLDTSSFHPGGALVVKPVWRAIAPPREDFVVFVHLLHEEDILVSQNDAEPAAGQFPTSAWQQNTIFGDKIHLPLPKDLQAGEYRVIVGMYRWPSLKRLPVLSEVRGAEIDVVELDSVSYQ